MSAFADLSSLDLQRIWDGVHGRVVHGELPHSIFYATAPTAGWRRTIGTSKCGQSTESTSCETMSLRESGN